MIYSLESRESVKDTMQRHGLLSIEQLMQLDTASFMFKYINDLLPPAFQHFLQENRNKINDSTASRQTRSNSIFFPSFCRINITKQSLKHKGPLAWSKVPSQLKKVKSYQKFRRELKLSYCNKAN